MKTKVSFIIPALNEEKRIATIIDSIKKLDQDYNYEIIVADDNSTDKTKEIAKRMGAVVITNNKDAPKTIANGRNTGASLASGEIFIFCDADTAIRDPNNFLAEVLSVFENSNIVGGAPRLCILPDETNWKDKIFHYFYNIIVRLSLITRAPVCGGQCQIIRGSSFREVQGYNVNIVHGEDSDLFRRLRKTGKLHYFSKHIVFESARRYRHFGYAKSILLGIYSLVYQQIFKKNVFEEWERIEYS
jgi:glycosyltransferase involved in cell wall biosynthesis